MAMPRLDPRVSSDRLYDYEAYQRLRDKMPARRKRSAVRNWYQYIPPMRVQYRAGLLLGVVVLLSSLALMAFYSADSARLEYSKQELEANLGKLAQSHSEATGEQTEHESALYTGDVISPAEVVYPSRTRYLVLTNIPEATGKRLVTDLYPLSRQIIRLDP